MREDTGKFFENHLVGNNDYTLFYRHSIYKNIYAEIS